MRLAFLFMLFLNVAFFAWQTSQVKPPVPVKSGVSTQNDNGNSIILLHERDDKTVKGRAPDSSSTPLNNAPGVEQTTQKNIKQMADSTARIKREPIKSSVVFAKECFTLGPFDIKTTVERAVERLQTYGMNPSLRVSEKLERLRYWVIEPSINRDEAEQKLTLLRKKGFNKVYIVQQGNQKNAISFGFYKAMKAAQKKVVDLNKLGFNPMVEKNFRVRNVYWVDFEETINHRLTEDQLNMVLGGYQGILKTPRMCK